MANIFKYHELPQHAMLGDMQHVSDFKLCRNKSSGTRGHWSTRRYNSVISPVRLSARPRPRPALLTPCNGTGWRLLMQMLAPRLTRESRDDSLDQCRCGARRRIILLSRATQHDFLNSCNRAGPSRLRRLELASPSRLAFEQR